MTSRVPVADARAYRLSSLDLLRGLVIVIMALDHVRDSFHFGAQQDPMADPNIGAALFFTRWITHFCAPVFVFLAGTSAGLMAARRTRSQVGGFLLKRGLWLIAIEWFVIATAITFAPRGIGELGGRTLVVFQVIWAIGASMVVLSGVQFLGRTACLVLGGAIVLLHNLLDPVWPSAPILDPSTPLWVGLHAQMSAVVGPFFVLVAYPVLPWIGVMLSGYGLSGVFQQTADARNRQLLRWGVALTGAFVAVRLAQIYGDPNLWMVQGGGPVPTLIDFLNVTKYPPSLLFLLMTLGPVWLLIVAALYPWCRWMASVKARRSDWWLSYL